MLAFRLLTPLHLCNAYDMAVVAMNKLHERYSMFNKLTFLAATATIALSANAFAADEHGEVKSKVEYKKDGGYESTMSSDGVNAAGAKLTSDRTVDVDVDSKGRVDKKVNVESTTDPKGLMNKKHTDAETKIEEKENGGYKQTTTRTHTDADGTNTTYETITDVDIDNKGNVKSTATTKKTVDPKGLMNEKTTKTTTKTVNGKVVEEKTK